MKTRRKNIQYCGPQVLINTSYFFPHGLFGMVIEPEYFLRLDVIHFFKYKTQLLLENLATFITHETLFDKPHAFSMCVCPNFVHFPLNFPNLLHSS